MGVILFAQARPLPAAACWPAQSKELGAKNDVWRMQRTTALTLVNPSSKARTSLPNRGHQTIPLGHNGQSSPHTTVSGNAPTASTSSGLGGH